MFSQDCHSHQTLNGLISTFNFNGFCSSSDRCSTEKVAAESRQQRTSSRCASLLQNCIELLLSPLLFCSHSLSFSFSTPLHSIMLPQQLLSTNHRKRLELTSRNVFVSCVRSNRVILCVVRTRKALKAAEKQEAELEETLAALVRSVSLHSFVLSCSSSIRSSTFYTSDYNP